MSKYNALAYDVFFNIDIDLELCIYSKEAGRNREASK
jgi:hypothetical protein